MRYFIEVTYDGTAFSGFQVQQNANTIQAEIERALATLFAQPFSLTGSSRTDAGVHALQNYFQADTDLVITAKHLYNLNAILPATVAINSIRKVNDDAHCRFAATSREYRYFVHQTKNPFTINRSWFYPYTLDIEVLNQLAAQVKTYRDFEAFSKRNTQVFTHKCTIYECRFEQDENGLVFYIKGNRFLRGMVRGLVSTLLKFSRKENPSQLLNEVFMNKDCTRADFTAPGHGLFLSKVNYPESIWG